MVALLLGSFLAAGIFAAGSTWLVLKYAHRRALLDYPGPRSLHSRPTPRGGGVTIAIAALSASAVFWQIGWLDQRIWQAFAPGACVVALVGWIDDHRHVPEAARATAHLLAALLLMHFMGWPRELDLGFRVAALGWFGPILYLVSIVWVVNLFNFMDGIDGIAATQAMIGMGVGALLLLGGASKGLPLLAATVAGASAGFLVWNRPPARIFMGDVGSGFLGYAVVFFGFAGARVDALPLLVWMMLFGIFLFDATATVLRRMAQGGQWYVAHRTHAYQRLVQAGMSHGRVTSVAAALICAVAALAVVAYLIPSLMLLVILVGFGILLFIYLRVERIQPMPKPESRSD